MPYQYYFILSSEWESYEKDGWELIINKNHNEPARDQWGNWLVRRPIEEKSLTLEVNQN